MIRKGVLAEIDAIMALTRACASKMESEGIFQWNAAYPYPEAFQKDIDRNELYVLELQDRVAGCITISTLKDVEYESIEWITPDGSNYYIHRLAIHPDFQHQGWARKLMDFAEETTRAYGGISIRLDTFSKNLRNQRFYEARGYTRLGEIFFPKQSSFPFYCYEKLL